MAFQLLKRSKNDSKKINSYAHQEFNTEDFKDIEKIKKESKIEQIYLIEI